MTSVSMTQHVNAALETVWDVATDIEHATDWLSGVDRVELLEGAGEPFRVGTRWRETRTIMGRQASEEMAATAVDPHRSYTVEADNGGVHYVSTYEFLPQIEGTTVRFTFGAEGGGLLARLTAPLGKWMVGKQLRKDLVDLAQAAEGRVG